MLKTKIILASSSPRRLSILKKHGFKPLVMQCPDEIECSDRLQAIRKPSSFVMRAAYAKAENAGCKLKRGVILAADTIIYFRGRIIGKPHSVNDAYKILTMLSGKSHYVYTGVAILDVARKEYRKGYSRTTVRMREMNRCLIKKYFDKVDPMDKAGAYAIQEYGDLVISGIRGELDNVIGLPMKVVYNLLDSI